MITQLIYNQLIYNQDCKLIVITQLIYNQLINDYTINLQSCSPQIHYLYLGRTSNRSMDRSE